MNAVPRTCSVKKLFLKIWHNSQENTSVGVSFLMKLQAFNFIKKETPTQVLHSDLKLVSTVFFCFLHQMRAVKNYEKCFFFHLKIIFCSSQDTQIFVFSASTPFPPVRYCSRRWSKINLTVYDVINWLNENLKGQSRKLYNNK